MSYYITTDSCSDITEKFLQKFNIENCDIAPITYVVDGKLYDITNEKLDEVEFYKKMRAGSSITTSLINTFAAEEFFRNILKQGFDILHLSFSSGISGTYEAVSLAAKNLQSEFSNRKIIVLDTKIASLGVALIFYYANKKRNSGASIEECANYANDLIRRTSAIFIVDDLKHLQRTGRVSKVEAFVGTALQIKPILHMDDNGKLIPFYKTISKKKAIKFLAEKVKEKYSKEENDLILISHGDVIDDADSLSKLIKENLNLDSFIDYVSPTIGAHSGPGTVAIFCISDSRDV